MLAKSKFLFMVVNVLLIVAMVTFLIHPAAESLQIARSSVRLAESRYAFGRRLASEYEANLLMLEMLKQEGLIQYSELPLILAEISRLVSLNHLHQVNFVASEPIIHVTAHVDQIYEMRVRAEYEGDLHDVSSFLYALDMVDVSVVFVNFEDEGHTRVSLEFSIFAVGE